MPTTANLDGLYQGDNYATTVDLQNPDGTPFLLTGYGIRAQLRQSTADAAPTVAAEFTTLIDAFMPGRVNLALPPSATASLSGSYMWDLQLTDPAGKVTTVVSGFAPVTAEVTR